MNSRRTLAVLTAINLLNIYDRVVLGAITEPLRKEFHLSDTQVGLLGTGFTLVYALAGLPMGRLADTWSRKYLLSAGIFVWTALTAASGWAMSYSALLLTRLGVAVGEAVCGPAATSWIGDLFPRDRRARAMAVFMLGVPLGNALSFLINGPITQAWGWRIALTSAALPAILLLSLLRREVEPQRGAAGSLASPGAYPWQLLRIPTLWWIIASGAIVNFILYALSAFQAAFLTRFHGLSVAQAGAGTGIAFGAGGVIAGLCGGYLGDRMIRRRVDGRMLLAATAALMAVPTSLVAIAQPAGAGLWALVWLAVSYGLLSAYYGLVYATIQDIVTADLRGTAMAVYFLAMYLCGASFGPLITGNLSDRLAERAAAAAGLAATTEAFRAIGLRQAMFVIPVLTGALALVLYAGAVTLRRRSWHN